MVDVVNSDWQLQLQLQMPLANRQVAIRPLQGMGMHMLHMGDVHLGLKCMVVGGWWWWLSLICILPFD